MTVTNSGKKSVIVATPGFLLKVSKRTFQQKVHSSVTWFKKLA